jgi:hypothetical protein
MSELSETRTSSQLSMHRPGLCVFTFRLEQQGFRVLVTDDAGVIWG